jgi:pyruvate,water dikinase
MTARALSYRATIPVLVGLLIACGDDDAAGWPDSGVADAGQDAAHDAGDDAALDGGDDGGAVDYLTELASPDDYARLALDGELRYLAPIEGATPEPPLDAPCVFQNMERFAFHVQFLATMPAYASVDFPTYTNMVLRKRTRVFYGGMLKQWPSTPHPITDKLGVISYGAYQTEAPGEAFSVDELAFLHERLTGCMPYARDLLVLVPDGSTQTSSVLAQREALLERGVPVLLPDDLIAGLGAEVYSEGESYGYLRIVPEGEPIEDYAPREVLIASSAPNDIGIVSGLITKNPQSLHSHVSLRLREKATPNASVPDIYDNAFVHTLDGSLVHVIARGVDVQIEPARLADAEAFWDATRPTLPPLSSDLDVTELIGFDALRHADANAYGTKAANLGELHRVLPAEQRVEGFGVPFSAYRAFIEHNALQAHIDALLEDERARTDRPYLEAQLKALRDALKVGELPSGLASDLREAAIVALGSSALTTRLRFRSSTNAEDLEALSGAGLYDSKSGCIADDEDDDALGPSHCLSDEDADYYQDALDAAEVELAEHPERTWLSARIADYEQELSEEKSAAGALAKVWASLWTLRAFEERAYYGLDHRDVYMGIAVNPAFVGEKLDAVVVTNVPSGVGGPRIYRIVTQVAEVGVVRPDDPTAVPETLVFQRSTDDTLNELEVLVPSSFATSAQDSLWTMPQLEELATAIFQIQDHFEADVYPEIRPLALDLEVKLTRDDDISIKQSRPY